MFKFLDRYFINEFNNVCLIVICLFFPFIFLSDFVITGSFNFYIACSKIFFRYGQMLPLILLISSYLTTINILYKHPKELFLQLNCGKWSVTKSLVFMSFFYSFIYYFIIIPSNGLFFEQKTHNIKWIVNPMNEATFFIYKQGNNQYYIYQYNHLTGEIERKNYDNLDIGDDEFFIVWNDTKKLSCSSLKKYRIYLKKHNWHTHNVDKQIYIYLYRFFLLLIMLFCGYVFALKKSLGYIFFVFLSSTWIDILAFYLNVEYCILVLCLNLIAWSSISFIRFLY